MSWDFWSFNILSQEALGGEEVNEMRPRDQTSTGGAGLLPGYTLLILNTRLLEVYFFLVEYK
jgi:hypothetical protein